MGLTAPGAKAPSLQQSANLANQLQLIKDLLSAPITALVDDSSKIKEILEQIESQLPESLRVKLWPAGHLRFLSRQIISGDDKDDEEIIARVDVVHADAIHAIEKFLN